AFAPAILRHGGVRREPLRLAVLLWITPFGAARMISGWATFSAASALLRSPAAIASSILPTALRRRERRALLISVRRAIWRVALRADDVLAIRVSRYSGMGGRPRELGPRRFRAPREAARSHA